MEFFLTEKKNLITIKVAVTDIVWLKKGKEALIQGMAFDVKTAETHGDQLILTGIFDHEEDELMRIKKKSQENEKGKDGRWIGMILFPFHPIGVNDVAFNPSPIFILHHHYHSLIPKSPYLLEEGPPPRLNG